RSAGPGRAPAGRRRTGHCSRVPRQDPASGSRAAASRSWLLRLVSADSRTVRRSGGRRLMVPSAGRRQEGFSMPTYMDVHEGFVGVTKEQLEEAHRADTDIQAEEGVSFD